MLVHVTSPGREREARSSESPRLIGASGTFMVEDCTDGSDWVDLVVEEAGVGVGVGVVGCVTLTVVEG